MQLGFLHPRRCWILLRASVDPRTSVFPPDRSRLAVAAMTRQLIVVFDIEVRMTPADKQVHLITAVELSSSQLQSPHGQDFIDDKTLAVANREGDLTLF